MLYRCPHEYLFSVKLYRCADNIYFVNLVVIEAMRRKPIIVAVEGIIGAGKSSLLKQLQLYDDIAVIQEPVYLWNNVTGGVQSDGNANMLHKMYQNPTRWCFTFQIWALCTRLEAIQPTTQSYVHTNFLSSK